MTNLEKFKSLERAVESQVPENSYVVMRLDGKAFHTFTKGFERPYDKTFAETMNRVAEHLADTVTGTLFAYVQSDEISVVFSDLATPETQMWLGGRLQKMVSVAAANATAKFMRVQPTDLIPVFDARVHTLADPEEIKQYVLWRRRDATKNAITMAANTLHSHKSLMGKSTTERSELLKGTHLEVLPDEFLYGRLVTKEYSLEPTSYVDKRTNETHTVTVRRGRWVSNAATEAALDELPTDPAANR